MALNFLLQPSRPRLIGYIEEHISARATVLAVWEEIELSLRKAQARQSRQPVELIANGKNRDLQFSRLMSAVRV